MEASMGRQMAMSNYPALRPPRENGNVPQKTRQSVFLPFCIYALPNPDCSASIKRTRSASTTSDRPTMSKPPHEETPAQTPKSIAMPAPPVPPPKSSSSRNRRGGGGRSRPSAQAQDAASVDGDEGEIPYRPNSLLSDPVSSYTYIYSWRRSSRAE